MTADTRTTENPDPLLRLPCNCDNDGWYVHDPDCLRGIAWEARAEARESAVSAVRDWSEPCGNCDHPFAQHTGRSIRPDDMRRLPGTRLGPISPRWGGGCEATAYPKSTREDWHHTCPCSAFHSRPSDERIPESEEPR